MRNFILAILIFNGNLLLAQGLGIFSNSRDIGNPKSLGSAIFDIENQVYTLSSPRFDVSFEMDGFHYIFNEIEGDFIISANFESIGKGTNPHLKTGFMIRESTAQNAAHASAVLHGDGSTVLQWKNQQMNGSKDQIFAPKYDYNILQLERRGSVIIMRAAHWGEPLQTIGSRTMENLKGKVLLGLFINSHTKEVTEKVKVWNVRIDKPVEDGYSPNEEGWLGCRLETISIVDGMRKVIYEKSSRFEAPNWMPDGEKLLFNMEGSLYTIPVNGGELSKLDTGFANNLNNDHGISFDGKLIAISHHRKGLKGGGSSIYVLPLEGGIPKLVTEETPSYWHGWAPNNEDVVYVATREGNPTYDIYKKSILGGKEVMLTDTQENEHVDGCEYSPDGEYIYYNSSTSGTMQIWRMKPDGSQKEQITFDENNDWFPHISPDGKWIVYISFPAEIPVNDHPSYKRVTLNLIPAEGGAPKVIAYLYGGQGTINVPSWSPDSKHFAFVSNSGK